MDQTGPQHEWTAKLRTNDSGRPVLTLADAVEIARWSRSGWYIAPFAMRWTVGKLADGTMADSFHVIGEGGEPLTFDTVAQALDFLTGRLGVFRVAMFAERVGRA